MIAEDGEAAMGAMELGQECRDDARWQSSAPEMLHVDVVTAIKHEPENTPQRVLTACALAVPGASMAVERRLLMRLVALVTLFLGNEFVSAGGAEGMRILIDVVDVIVVVAETGAERLAGGAGIDWSGSVII